MYELKRRQAYQTVHVPKGGTSHHRVPHSQWQTPDLIRVYDWQQTPGNQAVQHLLRSRVIHAKLTINQPGDQYEQEADRMADAVMHIPDPVATKEAAVSEQVQGISVQRMCPECEEELHRWSMEGAEEEETLETKEVPGQITELTPAVEASISALRRGGQPLSQSVRTFFESRFGHDFSQVRVHTDARATEMAHAVNARAFTVGHNVVFGAGQYAPDTLQGRRLLAHELTHIVQQAAGDSDKHTVFLQREEEPINRFPEAPNLPPFSLSGTGLTVIPGPLHPFLLGQRVPLPANLRITNAFGVGPGPTFVLDLSPRLLMTNILGAVDLYTWTRPGTPPDAEPGPENQARISLINPRITLDPTVGRLRGNAILSVGSDYPPVLKGPTEINVDIESAELGQFTGRLGYGPLHANFTLKLRYDTDRLEQALTPALAPEGGLAGLWNRFQVILRDTVPGVRFGDLSDTLQSLLRSVVAGDLQATEFVTRTIDLIRESVPAGTNLESLRTALTQFANEITHPGFTLGGRLGLDIPLLRNIPLLRLLRNLPLAGFRAEAPTTVPLARPLLGAPSAFPLSFTAGGVIIAPPGSLRETAVPALGITHSSFGERSGFTGTAALLPTLSPSAISAGEPVVNQFPIYAYAEFSYVRRVSNELDLGLRLTFQYSTPQLFGPGERGSDDPAERLRRMLQDYQVAQQRESPTPVTPNIGLTLYGRFNAL